jgi:hypothetical protein
VAAVELGGLVVAVLARGCVGVAGLWCVEWGGIWWCGVDGDGVLLFSLLCASVPSCGGVYVPGHGAVCIAGELAERVWEGCCFGVLVRCGCPTVPSVVVLFLGHAVGVVKI